jgi:filamentous hemagglutinin family protein
MSTPTHHLPRRHRLTPLAAALAMAIPPACLAAGPVVPPPVYAVPQVPQAGATWRTYGTGNTAGPINVPNNAGGFDQTISQTSQKAIYNWQSFDIGATSSVTFQMALQGASALNRVTGSTAPSQIFGRLTATNNGEIYLINANGILFGRTAVVNTGALIASGLDVSDDNFKASLVPTMAGSLTPATAFQYGGDPADFIDTKNFVRVDPGATITTASGGRVFLFAKNVENDGTITTPDGQTALAAGSQVYLRLPSTYPEVYAAESNPDLPVLRGLLVEVGDVYAADHTVSPDAHLGTVTNAATGTISTPRGNATLVGMAVNQMGRVSATTSVSENGTIFLRAQGNAVITPIGTDTPVIPQSAGTLTIGPASRTEILPDTTQVNGAAPTSNDTTGFITSRIDMMGQTVELQSGAAVLAPGAIVNVRAETVPSSTWTTPTTTDTTARIVLDAGASINVSGTRDTTASVGRFFVATDLLTTSDLADSPLQKDGILYHAKTTIDVREDSLILGDLSRYRDALERTVDERLSTGGSVNMTAQGAVLLAPGSRIDVSGGEVTYQQASVQPTQLVSSTGAMYTLNDAPADQIYLYGLNMSRAGTTQYDRWGEIPTPGLTAPPRTEPGYVEGRDAGTLLIDAPTVVMQGTLAAQTVTGDRQHMGLDPLAATGRLVIGDPAGFDKYDGAILNGQPTLLTDFRIDAQGPALTPGAWQNPLQSTLDVASGVALSTITQAGFGTVTVSAHGDVGFDAGTDLALADHAALTLESATGDVALAGHVTAHDGAVTLLAQMGQVSVGAGAQVDLSGRWVNLLADGGLPEDTSATAGGRFVAQGERGIVTGVRSLVDVSGGASVTAGGALVGGNAGSIALVAGRTDIVDSDADPASRRLLVLAGALRGEALRDSTGAALSLRAPSVRIGNDQAGAPGTAFRLDPAFFTQSGFSSYAIDGLDFLDVSAGTTVAPSRQSWYAANANYRFAPTGSDIRGVLASGTPPLAAPATVNLALASSGVAGSFGQTGGELDIDAGSQVRLVPGSAFAGTGATRVRVDGGIVDHGGNVALSTPASGPIDQSSYVWLGEGASIDVSGTTVVTPSTDGLLHGTVQDGGNVTLSAAPGLANATTRLGTSIVLQEGSRIDLDGTTGTVAVAERDTGGTVTAQETLASHGGSLTITGTSNLALEGSVSARGGNAQAAGGSITVNLLGATDQFVAPITTPAVLPALRVVDGLSHDTIGLTPDQLPTPQQIATANDTGPSNAQVSAQWIRDSGAADLTLAAPRRLYVSGDVDLQVARNLTLDTQALVVDNGAQVVLGGANTIVGNTRQHVDPNGIASVPPPVVVMGTGALTIQGTDLVLDGSLVTQGVGALTLQATHDLQLRTTIQNNTGAATLSTAADVTLSAAQVYPATGQQYTISAPDHQVTITGGDPAAPKPLSAGGSLTIAAGTIEQDGVVRAPFGSITLDATGSLALGAGSETSVSGAGLVVQWGSTINGGTTWHAPGDTVDKATALPGKTLNLQSQQVTMEAGAIVDLSGGGTVLAYEFVAGPGGSQDVFAGGNGSYAIFPGLQGLAPYDPDTFATAPRLGAQIVFGPNAPVPAGTYTLLPARYALMPGAFLVTPAGGTPMALGAVIHNVDGSALVGASTADANTRFQAAISSAWRVQTNAQAQAYSQIVVTSADPFFAAQAQSADLSAPRGASDGGVLQVAAGSANIAGTFDFSPARDASGQPLGLGGIAAFSASHIVVGEDSTPVAPGTLTLSASQLDAMAPSTLLLGATIGTAGAQGTTLAVAASNVEFSNTHTALTADDIVAVSTDSLTAYDGAAIVARAPSATSAAPAAFQVDGDGAALRVANASGASFVRTGSVGKAGSLQVGEGATLDAGAGTLLLDGPRANTIGGTATLHAADIALAGNVIVVGNASTSRALVLDDALLAQVNNASHLTLRGYDAIGFLADAHIGGNALESVTLDSGFLLSVGGQAAVDAGEIALANTTGAVRGNSDIAANPASNTGTLTLHADASQGSGRILLQDGTVAVKGSQTLMLQADRALVLDGSGTLKAGGDVLVQAPLVMAQAPTSQSVSAADYALNASGNVIFAGGGTPDTQAAATGAQFAVQAASISQGTDIELPTGQLSLAATQGDLTFEAGSRTSVAGGVRVIDGTPVGTGGGGLVASASIGNVNMATGAAIDVSAGGDAAGGSATFSAPQGTVALAGTLAGTATDPTRGARLTIDGVNVPSLAQVAAIQQQAPTNFDGTLDVRQRGEGAMTLAAGTILTAAEVDLDNDGGAIVVAGTIAAGGAQGGRIDLAARDDLTVAPGALLSVHASGATAPGGSIELTTVAGTLALQQGATLDLGADATANNPDILGGRLTLRAPRTGYSDVDPQGNDVAVATIGAQVLGASTVDVQAVKVYDGISSVSNDSTSAPGVLSTVQLVTDDNQFLGLFDGHVADAIAARVAGSNEDLLAQLRIHPEDEIRAPGDLVVAQGPSLFTASDDWALPNQSVSMGYTSSHVGDSSLTLRAQGDISVERTISAGFDAAFNNIYKGIDERYVTTNSEHSGNIRIVAGADFGAADAMRTGPGVATLSISRDDQPRFGRGLGAPLDAFNIVAVRATTGDIDLAASGDIDMQVNRSLVYTVGRPVDDAEAEAVRFAYTSAPSIYAFNIGAGDVRLRAGRSVLGSDVWREPLDFLTIPEEFSSFRTPLADGYPVMPDGTTGYADAWMLVTTGFWDSGTQHGAFSFGGGNVTVDAGKDVVNFEALSPTTGYVLRDPETYQPLSWRTFGGGNVSVTAARDVVNGMYESGGAELRVDAGRDVAWRASKAPGVIETGVRLLIEDGRIDATAGRDLTVDYAQDAMTTLVGYDSNFMLLGLNGDADARLQAAGGNAQMLLIAENLPVNASSPSQIIVPPRFSMTAPSGNIEVGGGVAITLAPSAAIDQFPVAASRFDLLAGSTIDFVIDPSVLAGVPTAIAATVDLSHGPQITADPSLVTTTPLDESDRTPVHIATVDGDITLGQIDSARPMRVSAGRDLTLQGQINITHQVTGMDGDVPLGETSSFQAGRDVTLGLQPLYYARGPLSVAGPGELLVLAGRNVDLGSGFTDQGDLGASGIEAIGNTANTLLPKVGANITVVAGLRADGSDYAQAARMGFAALGATGLTDHAADLFALLSANTGGGTGALASGSAKSSSDAGGLVSLGSPAAAAFAALDTPTQLAQVQALVGTSFYDAQLANYVRAQPGQSALSDAQAIAAFATLSASKQAAAPGVILAQSFAGQPQPLRDGFVAELAAASSTPYAADLVTYMQRQQGATLTLAQAISGFEALPLVQQIPLLDAVLVAELRVDGRAAAAATGSAQEAAYDRGYRTIATLFPFDRPEGNIEMPEAEIKTKQSASITVLAPGGGVDAGGVQASTISPDNLGIVTQTGGDIASVVRNDFLVNQSRVFTLAPGNLLIWSSEGNIDAGRGAKSVVGAPAPVLRIDSQTGLLFLDTSGSFTGSGIAVLDADSTLDLYAPAGAINAGEAGIKAAGNAFFAAQTFLGTDNLSVGGKSVGAPPPVVAGATATLAAAGNSLMANASAVADDEKDERRKRRMRRNLLIEFLGFGPNS